MQDDDIRKEQTRRQDIPVSESVHCGMTRAELSEAQEEELLLTQQDINMERTQEKKNYLESYVYETRTKVMLYSVLCCSLLFKITRPGLSII